MQEPQTTEIDIQVLSHSTPQNNSTHANKLILGSFPQAFAVDTLIAYASRGVLGALNPAVTAMNLNQTQIGVLGAAPLVTSLLTPIPMTYFVERDGGKKQVFFILGAVLTGMSVLTLLASLTDITTIDSVDWRYGTMLVAGYLIGCGPGNFALLLDSLKWARKAEQLSFIQSAYSCIVDISSITTPLAIYYLHNFGYAVPFGMYTGLIFLSMLVTWKFLHASPYEQLRKKMPKQQAEELAKAAGQLEIMIKDSVPKSWRSILADYFRLLCDRRGVVLNLAMSTALGSFFMTETVFPSLLTGGFGLDEGQAILLSSIANAFTLAARLAAGKLITHWDAKSGGIKVYMLGCAITIAAAIPLAFSDISAWSLYMSVAALNIGFGFNVVTPLCIATASWCKPTNKNLDEFNPAFMLGLLGTIGTLSGILLPIILGQLVAGAGQQGYRYYFIFIMVLTLISALTIPPADYNVKKEESVFNGPITLFSRIRNRISRSNYIFGDEDTHDHNSEQLQDKTTAMVIGL